MKRLDWKMNLAILIGGLFLPACSLLTNEPAPPIALPTSADQVGVPTLAPDLKPEPVDPTAAATEVVENIPTATDVPLDLIDPITPTATPTAASAVDGCVAPAPPAGVGTITYAVQAGDTLFTIGQNTRPAMTVEQIAAANCLTDVNRIEVGQQLVVWDSLPTTGAELPLTQVVFEKTVIGGWDLFQYIGPLLGSEHTFAFTGEAGNFLTIENGGPPAQNLVYKLQKADGTLIGQFDSTKRVFISPTLNGAEYRLPESGAYEVVVAGQQNMAIDFSIRSGTGYFQAQLAEPLPIQFETGATSARISGNTPPGSINQYKFVAFAGQTVRLEPIDSVVALIIENGDRVRLNELTGDPIEVQLPADGEYNLVVCHCFTEGVGNGPYTFDIAIEAQQTTQPAPQPPAAEPLTFTEAINGMTTAIATGNIDSSGTKTFQLELANSANLTINSFSIFDLTFELLSADGATQIGAVSTLERNFLSNLVRGGDISVPGAGTYLLKVNGTPGDSYNIGLTFGGLPHPEMVTPTRVQFEAGATSTDITGEIARDQFGQGGIDRYIFTAAAGQNVTLVFLHAGITNVMIEDMNQTVILDTLESGNTVTLPADGDYIMNVWLSGGEVYGSGPYDFSLIIE